MDTAQLDCLLRRALSDSNVKFLGVFPADRIPQSSARYPSCFVANVDPHDMPGQHWIACFLPNSRTVRFFDSYGLPPSCYPALDLPPQCRVIVNTSNLQSPHSKVCGHYCVYFLCATAYKVSDFSGVCTAPLRYHPSVRDRRIRRFVEALRARIGTCVPCVPACGSRQCCRAKFMQLSTTVDLYFRCY
jgi:hypothetical protein